MTDTCKNGHELTEDNVYRHSLNPNWRQCRTCTKDRRRRRYFGEKGVPVPAHKRRYRIGSGPHPPYVRDQAKKRAGQLLRDAVKNGKIEKPSTCQRCGHEFPKTKLDGHHWKGYDRPLDVRWLCRECHWIEDHEAA